MVLLRMWNGMVYIGHSDTKIPPEGERAEDEVNYDGLMDEECVELCNAINRLPGIETNGSCCGHGESPYFIGYTIVDLKYLPPLLYFLDWCHSGAVGWKSIINSDCGMGGPFFYIEGPIGEQAYEDAEKIAEKINKYVDESIEYDHKEE